MKNNNTTINSICNNSNEKTANSITLSTFGEFCKAFSNPENKLSATKKSMTEYGISETMIGEYSNLSERLYCAVSAMMTVRETESNNGSKGMDLIKASECSVKQISDTFFTLIGTRPAKKGEEKLRPAYGTRNADYAIYGEMVAKAMSMAKGSVIKAQKYFFELLIMSASRILNGEGFQRITKAELTAQKAQLLIERAEKAKNTREENEKSDVEEAKKEAETAKQLETLELSLADKMTAIEKAIALVMESHATEEEKKAIVAVLKVSDDK